MWKTGYWRGCVYTKSEKQDDVIANYTHWNATFFFIFFVNFFPSLDEYPVFFKGNFCASHAGTNSNGMKTSDEIFKNLVVLVN